LEDYFVDAPTPNDLLYEKLTREMDDFIDGLKEKSKDEILVAAFEKVWREEILMTFETSYYSDAECAAMMKLPNALGTLYSAWMDMDSDYLEDLRGCINGVVAREAGESEVEQSIEEVTETVAPSPPVNVFVPQDYGSPLTQDVSAQAINGKLYVGDWVIVRPDEDYGRLVGRVTAIEKLGSDEHDTDNDTDDVHVEFITDDYFEKDEARIIEGLKRMRPDATSFDDFALDDVIMAPETLVSLTGNDIQRVDDQSEALYQLREDANDFLRAYFGSMENELVYRVEQNYADYCKSLDGFGTGELIDMAATIHAYSDAYSYLTLGYHGFSDDELQFFTSFESPLEVVAEAWHKRNIDLEDMSFTLDHLMERKDSVLEDYPLITDKPEVSVADEPEVPTTVPETLAKAADKPKSQPPLNKKPSILDRMAANKVKVEEYKAQMAQNPQTKTKSNNKERD
jgi:hypothetical protein